MMRTLLGIGCTVERGLLSSALSCAHVLHSTLCVPCHALAVMNKLQAQQITLKHVESFSSKSFSSTFAMHMPRWHLRICIRFSSTLHAYACD